MTNDTQGTDGAGTSYQERVRQHFLYVAGDDTTDMSERRDRACEEFAELQQSLDGTLEGWIAVGRYVWNRPIGEPAQEMGGTLNTLAALAAWADLDMMACGEAELERTKRPEIVAKIRRKRANRHGRGPLPGDDADLITASSTPAPATPPGVPDSVRALIKEADELPNPERSLLSHNERVLIEFCQRLSQPLRALIAAQPAGQAGDAGVPVEVRKAIAFAAEAEGKPNGGAARRYAGLCCLQWVETLLSPQADKQTEPPALRAVVEVYPDRTDTRLTFGDRIQPEPGVKAVQQAIAALTAEYEARGGCPVVGRHPAGQSGGTGAETDALVDRFSAALKAKLRAAEAKYGWQNGWLQEDWAADCQRDLLRHVSKGDPLDVAAYAAFCWHHGWPTAPNNTRTGAAETERPDGAIYNGREHLRRLGIYGFTANDGHVLDHCEDYIGAQQCFEVMADALAARPKAPSDAGCAEIEDRLSEILTASQRQDLSDRLLSAYMAPHGGLRLDNAEVAYLWTRLGGSLDLPTPPSDPAPSGQAEG